MAEYDEEICLRLQVLNAQHQPLGGVDIACKPEKGAEISLKRYRYTGKERDEETGFYYHGARYYAPWIGRWTRCAPKELVDGPNMYSYVYGNPLRYTDPTGTQGDEGPLWGPTGRANLARAIEKVGGPSLDPTAVSYGELLWKYQEQVSGSSKRVAAPDREQSSLRATPAGEEIEGRVISFPDESGEGFKNQYVQGTRAKLDQNEDEAQRQASFQMATGLAFSLAGIRQGRLASPATEQSLKTTPENQPPRISAKPSHQSQQRREQGLLRMPAKFSSLSQR